MSRHQKRSPYRVAGHGYVSANMDAADERRQQAVQLSAQASTMSRPGDEPDQAIDSPGLADRIRTMLRPRRLRETMP